MRAGGDLDVVREALALVLQALIEAEAAQHDRRRPLRAHRRAAPPTATAPAPGCCRPRPATSSCTSPSSGRARSSRRCWSRAGASTGRCWRWSWRPTSTASPPARSTTWSRPWASTAGISKSEVSRICAELDGEVAAFRAPLAGPHRLPVPVPRRHLRQGPRRRPGRQPGDRDRHRGDRRRRPGGPGPGRRRQRGRRLLDRASCARSRPAGWPGVQLVISDAHTGLKAAIGAVMPGAGLAALPGPLPAQRARPGAQGLGRDGRRGHPHHLRPAHRRRGHRPGRQGRGHARSPSSRPWRRCSPTPART